ncbi:MAG: hypothetical protein L3K09_08640 [Thermoplasmata archaeon]|nr:hypothetical protein [Thermoplasmata archaeon]
MADEAEPGGEGARSVSELPLHRQLTFYAFAGLLVLALVFYLWWGFSFGVWVDNGIYAVVVVLAMFGLAGMWLMMPNPPVHETLPG